MKLFLKKTFIFSILPGIVISVIICYNIVIDPFGVIRGNMNNQVTEPNQHYLKTKYILNHPNKYNAFLFGSSRVGKINVSNFKNTTKWYNMTYSMGEPEEHLIDIKLFLESGVEISKISIGIDEISFLQGAELHKNQPLRKPYSDKLFLDYILLNPSYSVYKAIKEAPSNEFFSFGVYNTIYINGVFGPNLKDKYIENNKDTHRKDPIFDPQKWSKINLYNINTKTYNKITRTISVLKQIVDLCKNHNIELIIFVNPIYGETYKYAVANGLLNSIEQLSLITDFYDFSGINQLTTEKTNYYEQSHYRPLIGDFIVRELNSINSKYKVSKNKSNYWLESKKEEARTHNILYE